MDELDIKLTYKCNNNCIYCLNKDKRGQEVDYQEIKKRVSEFADKGGGKLIISGGEPLIDDNFIDLLNFSKKRGLNLFEIQTNGRMLSYESLVKKIIEFGKVSFLVSFHFSNPEDYKKNCQIDGFDQVVRGIKNLQKHGLSFTLNIVTSKKNIDQLEDIFTYLRSVDVTGYRAGFRFIDGSNFMDKYKSFVPKYTEIVPVIKKIIQKNSELTFHLNEFPYCVLSENLREKVSHLRSDRSNLTNEYSLKSTEEIYNCQFSLSINCKNCDYLGKCRGIRNEYLEVYGGDEFIPITKN